MHTITDIKAEEVLDSRGKATVKATVWIGKDAGAFSVPSGASTGTKEAKELRDEDGHMSQAVRNIHDIIAPKLVGKDAADQEAIDAAMHELDGTPDKSRLGGNAMLGVSVATAKAVAAATGVELWQYIRSIAAVAPSRPVPYLYSNYINGGKHAMSPLSLQEHIVVPDRATAAEAVAVIEDIDAALVGLLIEKYGPDTAGSMGDEGGYVIPEHDPFVPFELLWHAIELTQHKNVFLATDAAASSFFDGTYAVGGEIWDAPRLARFYCELAERFPILSIEDPFEEGALDDFVSLQHTLPAGKAGHVPRIVGDDLTVTSGARITEAAHKGAIRAVIIKPNQIGTLSETFEAMRAARAQEVDCIVSHRSGETMDTFIADLAYGTGAFGLKAGALRRPERRVKYDRLLEITKQS